MYWRICLDSVPNRPLPAPSPAGAGAPPGLVRGAVKSLLNPLRLAFAPASPRVGEEGDHMPEGMRHA